MLDLGKDLLFCHDMLFLMFLYYVFFFEHFESKYFVVLLAGDKTDLCVGTLANNTDEVEVVHGAITHRIY